MDYRLNGRSLNAVHTHNQAGKTKNIKKNSPDPTTKSMERWFDGHGFIMAVAEWDNVGWEWHKFHFGSMWIDSLFDESRARPIRPLEIISFHPSFSWRSDSNLHSVDGRHRYRLDSGEFISKLCSLRSWDAVLRWGFSFWLIAFWCWSPCCFIQDWPKKRERSLRWASSKRRFSIGFHFPFTNNFSFNLLHFLKDKEQPLSFKYILLSHFLVFFSNLFSLSLYFSFSRLTVGLTFLCRREWLVLLRAGEWTANAQKKEEKPTQKKWKKNDRPPHSRPRRGGNKQNNSNNSNNINQKYPPPPQKKRKRWNLRNRLHGSRDSVGRHYPS